VTNRVQHKKYINNPIDNLTVNNFLFVQLYKFTLEYRTQFEIFMEIPMNVTIMNACFYRDRHLIENANFVSLINEIEQKYAALREKALRLLSKGNRQNPRPMAEAKKVFVEMEESIDKMKRDRNTVTKYMKKIGFQLPSMQE